MTPHHTILLVAVACYLVGFALLLGAGLSCERAIAAVKWFLWCGAVLLLLGALLFGGPTP